MKKIRNKTRNIALGVAGTLMAGALIASQLLPAFPAAEHSANTPAASEQTALVSEYTGELANADARDILDPGVSSPLAKSVDAGQEISVIVQTTDDGLLGKFNAQSAISRYADITAYRASSEGAALLSAMQKANGAAKAKLERSGVKFSYGTTYETFFGGFEVVLKAGDYEKLAASLEDTGYSLSVSEVYAEAESRLVTNDVNVYDTGIFNSAGSGFDGSGTVIAVLDTGLDYTHSAFDADRFTGTQVLTLENLATKVPTLRAATMTRGLSAANVYYSPKVPYTYDYADGDYDVYPLESEHGTHVSGVIVGKDADDNKEGITGVAPNAQLASMKVFSDTQQGARWSWLVAALEDCVYLGVDVINMSLGTAAGFTTESDERQAYVYDMIEEAGISLVCAASNDYNSTYGSEKNGNLGLTTNPDSAVVGSPSTYTAALSVASISGVKTPYLTYNGQLMYFTESADASSEPRHFVDDLFSYDPFKEVYGNVDTVDIEYVTVGGVGRTADYSTIKDEIKGKIALVRRGSNSFEEKARVAANAGAVGVIIYNNVSGDITMTVGSVKIPVCSISQDNGEILSAVPRGTLHISRDQVAGPFMSNFSSWGPTPDLRIKPEITAHGGEIYSAVPGQSYDRLSGTSMASPNQAGVTALIRQYVKQKFPTAEPSEVTAYVNQIMMSTTDIAKNVNGLPYSVRKQGAGLANLTKATTSPAFITTYARNDADLYNQRFTDEVIDKAKIEVGDDPKKTGIYEMKFNIVNAFGNSSVAYDVDAIVMTEGISETKTHQGDMTVTEEGYLLEGAKVEINGIEGKGCTLSGSVVTVEPGARATVTLTVTLGDSDRKYLDQVSGRMDANGNDLHVFENGMYVEGYITLTPKSGTAISLSVPYLAFYGDWTQAPIFDLDYFETDKDAHNDAIETLDKTLPDAYATRPIGGLYQDYITYLGSYYFIQDPTAQQISAEREHIALTNQEGDTGGVNSIRELYLGMLRGARELEMTVTDATTGEVIWRKTEAHQRKSYSSGSQIYPSSVDVDFSVADYDLKNNTQYIFRVVATVDYGDGGLETNKRNVFEFPFTTDFRAPVVTDVRYTVEYDRTEEKNRLYANVSIWDNHYTMAYRAGQVYREGNSAYLDFFSSLPVPVFSERNATSEVTIELTDYIGRLANSYNKNTFVMTVYDYAMNESTFELRVPDDVRYLYFAEMQDENGDPIGEDEYGVVLNPNEKYNLAPMTYPTDSWTDTLVYTSSNEDVVRVVNRQLLALSSGTARITARSAEDESVYAELTVKVRSEEDEGYFAYDAPDVDIFYLSGYTTDNAFYFMGSSDRDISVTGARTTWTPTRQSYALSMFPSEQVTINYELEAYFPERTVVVFSSNNPNIASVSEDGQITALAEGIGSVSVRVMINNDDGTQTSTFYSKTISITVKNPYERNGPYLMGYRGMGGKVEIPQELGLTQIYQYAFSHYDYIPKDLSAGDVITEEDPLSTKIWYLGENQGITEVVLPEGIELIGAYAFAGMKNLQKVVIPSTCVKIAAGAFYGCTSLTEIEGLEHVKFINQDAFNGPAVTDEEGNYTGAYDSVPLNTVDLSGVIAIGDRAFMRTKLVALDLPESAQSLGASVFEETYLVSVNIRAQKMKLGTRAFANCASLRSIDVNASVIPESVFVGCTELKSVGLGADVVSIGANAFAGTAVAKFNVAPGNAVYKTKNSDGAFLYDTTGKVLLLAAPQAVGETFTDNEITKIGDGAFAGNTTIARVTAANLTEVGEYAFAGCSRLLNADLGKVTTIGDYAFAGTSLRAANLDSAESIGSYAFYATNLASVKLKDGVQVGDYAFAYCGALASVEIGDNAEIGAYAFAFPVQTGATLLGRYDTSRYYASLDWYFSGSMLGALHIGANAVLGDYAFSNAMSLTEVTLGAGARLGAGAFYHAISLENIDLSEVKEIGAAAFGGSIHTVYVVQVSNSTITSVSGTAGYTSEGVVITSADLSSVEQGKLGAGAFANCSALESVELGSLTEIPAQTFMNALSLASIDLSGIQSIGDGAFLGTALSAADLSKATAIGDSAFALAELTEVTLNAEGTTVGSGAFEANDALTSVKNLSAVTYFGDYAFSGTALGGVLDLQGATHIGDFAFMETPIENVMLSSALTEIGENPFAGCDIPRFTMRTPEMFHGVAVGEKIVDTYRLNDALQVIEGALFRTVPTGLELICYPAGSTEKSYTVPEGTVRISAFAFALSEIERVELPVSLDAIGDRAFYGCTALKTVVFKSLQAPILEEQYDEDWASWMYLDTVFRGADGKLYTSSPVSGVISGFEEMTGGESVSGLGIFKFFVWNMSDNVTAIFFGANFVDHVGVAPGDITMVRPVNGTGYDNIVMNSYFGTTIDGATAPADETLAAIRAIDALPELGDITLADAAKIREARRLYSAIVTVEQQSLVTNYQKLTSAEAILAMLEQGEQPEQPPETPPKASADPTVVTLGVFTGLFGLIAIGTGIALAVVLVRKKKQS